MATLSNSVLFSCLWCTFTIIFYLFSWPSAVKQVENLVHIPAACISLPDFPPLPLPRGAIPVFHISSSHPAAQLGEQEQVLNPTVFPFTRALKKQLRKRPHRCQELLSIELQPPWSSSPSEGRQAGVFMPFDSYLPSSIAGLIHPLSAAPDRADSRGILFCLSEGKEKHKKVVFWQ